ncbi:hypothetical protein JOE46_001014 [Rhodococcus sp. PvR099]|nr:MULTISPECIES: hypothetical protein [unclassified Rhodococcus (in: high G+C Gram-positive bacteria)]MBP1158855.1 hypothetical protein [Rhodococcus sp. PvR099]
MSQCDRCAQIESVGASGGGGVKISRIQDVDPTGLRKLHPHRVEHHGDSGAAPRLDQLNRIAL